jgi:hypothetical protein
VSEGTGRVPLERVVSNVSFTTISCSWASVAFLAGIIWFVNRRLEGVCTGLAWRGIRFSFGLL